MGRTFFLIVHTRFIIILPVRENNSSRFSSNSEAFASELLENIGERFPQYGDVFNISNFTPQQCLLMSLMVMVFVLNYKTHIVPGQWLHNCIALEDFHSIPFLFFTPSFHSFSVSFHVMSMKVKYSHIKYPFTCC